MAYEVEKQHESATDDSDALKMASSFSRPTTVITLNGEHYSFRCFEWMGKWGICDASMTKIIVRAKSSYNYASILPYSQVLVAGDRNKGWDVYSLTGKLLKQFAPMSLEEVTRILDLQKRNS